MECQLSTGRCVCRRETLARDFIGLMPVDLHGGDVVSGKAYSCDPYCAGSNECDDHGIRGRFYRDRLVQGGDALDHGGHQPLDPSARFDRLRGGKSQNPALPAPQLDPAGDGSLAPADIVSTQFSFTVGIELARADVCLDLRSWLADDGCFAIKGKKPLK